MKVVVTGGGTAGHINPGLAVAAIIREKHTEAEIIFIGTKKGMETSLVPREGYRLELIRVRGFNRRISLDTIKALSDLVIGMIQAEKLLRKIKPDVIVGTGGYVCGPVVLIAKLKGIPVLIHEQNVFPGITNKILSRFADITAISFKESVKYFKAAKKIMYTGNPVRNEIVDADRYSSRKMIGITEGEKLVVIFGGSLGAKKINDTVSKMLMKYKLENECRIIFATGKSEFDRVKDLLKNKNSHKINVVPYIYNAGEIFAASDLIICRAGAITCSEITARGIPAIMIPSPNVTANHQEYNARVLEQKGAAVMILEKDINERLLYSKVTTLLKDSGKLNWMAKNSRKLGVTNAAEKIHSSLMNLIGYS